ncbi:hypothetical protein [Gloeobacter violaceus]|uniref:Glr2039 protein n=1 Tax=Gloeobacter violaceus (strain ATCC 29082 / PCC 7421) TaxID=251221 RepID=Q7NIZ3_GLOVI|nr:hypothetical protein [Gloeobacter violaceus]BAC89980.1 glr2039 [Gloeobacter violaceus PCC 7421]
MRPLALTLALLLSGSAPALAIPVRQVAGVPMPDFEQITFRVLPALAAAGEIAITHPTVLKHLGYDPSRLWQVGAAADTVLMLGDVAGAFGLERFSLEQIAQWGLTGRLRLERLTLARLKMLAANTVGEIVKALAYEQLPPESVPLLRDLANYYFNGAIPYERLGELIAQVPGFAGLPLGTTDLAGYALSGLPGIERVAIGKLAGWASQYIRDIPGLSDVPFSKFLSFTGNFTGIAGLVDVPLSKIEHNRTRTITGSDVEGFAVPCPRDCLHVELGDPLRGSQWVGSTQQVRGGHGVLAAVNGGKEPTGRHPFGRWGKIVLTGVDEKAGKADFGLYLRVCIKTTLFDFGCTPYFLGPIPWIPSQEKALTFVGP